MQIYVFHNQEAIAIFHSLFHKCIVNTGLKIVGCLQKTRMTTKVSTCKVTSHYYKPVKSQATLKPVKSQAALKPSKSQATLKPAVHLNDFMKCMAKSKKLTTHLLFFIQISCFINVAKKLQRVSRISKI